MLARKLSIRELLCFYGIFLLGILTLILTSGCANQQPPGGGEEDKVPPKVSIISPKPNSLNFKGNSVVLEFNEYVDRRSFIDAFRISPFIKGDIEYNWSGKEVEVIFPQDLNKIYPNKTFVINISTTLKDTRGNSITEPVNLAFSTGSKIDMGGIRGKVFNNNNSIVSILAYKNDASSVYDPTKNIPDYLTESTSEGSYELTNLAAGKYRIIAIIDDDRNILFTSERESYGVLPYDADVLDSVSKEGINFYMKVIPENTSESPELNYNKYFKDSLGIVFTSIENGSRIVLPEQSIFIFFNRHKPERADFVNSIKVVDENGTPERVVFNWKNDSLVEVFPANRFASNRKYSIKFDLKINADSVYNFSLQFRTVSINSFGELKGKISSNYDFSDVFANPIRFNMEAESITPVLKYNFDVTDSVFAFKNILEADYMLFSFVDKNNSGVYDFGYPYPFEYSEPFYIYPQKLGIKGGWTVENVTINFVK